MANAKKKQERSRAGSGKLSTPVPERDPIVVTPYPPTVSPRLPESNPSKPNPRKLKPKPPDAVSRNITTGKVVAIINAIPRRVRARVEDSVKSHQAR